MRACAGTPVVDNLLGSQFLAEKVGNIEKIGKVGKVGKGQNGSKCLQTAPNGSKWL